MTNSQNIIGLAIISINDGRELGIVRNLIINPEKRAVEYLIVENDSWYLGADVIPFQELQGVGEYAATIESEASLQRLHDLQEVQELIKRNVKITGTKVLTKHGRMIGNVDEYFVDVNSGKISGCLLVPAKKDLGERIIPVDSVVTFGRDILVVVEDLNEESLELFSEAFVATVVEETVEVTEKAETVVTEEVKEVKESASEENENAEQELEKKESRASRLPRSIFETLES
ncbi:PRC-barrel domain-containing protein [Heliorestis convoluta]|uniref:PRC-barrel domain protein n=1 Tax=Heliorestis convoluta TaxID=356322 RepID=A0A5Q2N595_9FIRM|nr:PRC-barrel domain-containing protein [Heliorestis convoluta]QGG49069.1 PRC-barrel domain protein [Heliorestis convoluta]